MPKIEPGDDNFFLIDDIPYQRGVYQLDPNANFTEVGIKVLGRKEHIGSQQPVNNWTDNNDIPIPDFPSFCAYIKTFFFRDSSGGGSLPELLTAQLTDENNTLYGLVNGQVIQDTLNQKIQESTKLPDLRLVFQESFIGDASSTTFNLSGSIQNGVFSSGSWSLSNVIDSLPSHVVRSDNKKPTYDFVPNFLGNRVFVTSISNGLITLSNPPRNGLQFDVFYWYDTQSTDVIEDYQRIDFVSSMEADNSRIDGKIDQEATDRQSGDSNLQNQLDPLIDGSNTDLLHNHSFILNAGTSITTLSGLIQATVNSIPVIEINSLGLITLPFAGQRIENLSDPINNQDAGNKRYIDKKYEELTSLEVFSNSPRLGQTTEGLINNTTVEEEYFRQSFIPNKTGRHLLGGSVQFSLNDQNEDIIIQLSLLQGATIIDTAFAGEFRIEPKDAGSQGVVLNTLAGGNITGSANTSTDQRDSRSFPEFKANLTEGVSYDLVITWSGSANGDLAAIYRAKTYFQENLEI